MLPKKKREDVASDLDTDAWPKFEALVKRAAKMGHKPHTAKLGKIAQAKPQPRKTSMGANEPPKRHTHPLIEKIGIGLGTIGGVGAAACISALPSAQCREIAETYYQALTCFGSAVLAGLAVFAVANSDPEWVGSGKFPPLLMRAALVFFMAIGFVSLVGAMVAGPGALKVAVLHCWHDPAPMENQWRWIRRNLSE